MDVAEQMGVRQTRLLRGDYVVTKNDVTSRRAFRGLGVSRTGLLLRRTGRCCPAVSTSSSSRAATTRQHQRRRRISREIPPCMAMGQAAGIAAGLALQQGITVRDVDPTDIQAGMRAQGADPGDIPPPPTPLSTKRR